ncbi:MAG: efflux RND transporter periplasmic adaptor subunit [Polyangiaceae bacterium]
MCRAVFALGLGLSFGSSLVACGANESTSKPRTRPAPLVVAAKVEVRDVPVTIRAPVDLRPITQADVTSKTVGYLDAVLVDRGDKVKKGQLLATVRPSDLPDQLAVARGALAQAQAQVELTKANVDRARTLAPQGLISQQELAQHEAAYASAKAIEQANRAQISAAGARLGETRIESPLDGYVLSRRLDPGALVGTPAAGSIITVARTDTLRVFLAVNERDAAKIALDREVQIEVDALPGKRFAGRVARLAPAFDSVTRTLEAEIHLKNDQGELRPGMYGHGAIVVDVHKARPIIPNGALQISDRKRFVFVLEGDRVRRRPVETGVDEGDWLEIVSGLDGGEDLVVSGIDALSDGAQARVAKPAASASAPPTTQSAPSDIRSAPLGTGSAPSSKPGAPSGMLGAPASASSAPSKGAR